MRVFGRIAAIRLWFVVFVARVARWSDGGGAIGTNFTTPTAFRAAKLPPTTIRARQSART